MKDINLIYPDKSDIPYERSVFPDGENHIRFTDDINRKDEYNVICRIRSAPELFEVMQVGNILNRQAVEWTIDIYYLMSMRMDRVISFNEAYSLELVAGVINSLNPRLVRVFHAHSDKTFRLINNCIDLEYGYGSKVIDKVVQSYNPLAVCFPDSGAEKRYHEIKVNNDMRIVLQKVRDLENNGNIKSIGIAKDISYSSCSKILVIDDLCDAGGTFIGAAKVLREKHPDAELGILVHHMVNPKGIENLKNNYDHVYFTDSYNNWDETVVSDNVDVINIIGGLL